MNKKLKNEYNEYDHENPTKYKDDKIIKNKYKRKIIMIQKNIKHIIKMAIVL